MSAPTLLNNVKFFQKCIIVNKEGKVLAIRRTLDDFRRPGCWDLPGGTYEVGEGIEESVRREVREEVNLRAGALQTIHVSNRTGFYDDKITVIAICHICYDWEGDVKLSDEHIEYRWVTVEEYMQLETGDDEGFLKNSIQKFASLPSHA